VGVAYGYPVQPSYPFIADEGVFITLSQLYAGIKQKIRLPILNKYAVPSDLTCTAKKSYLRTIT
jgi:hypothetical protein